MALAAKVSWALADVHAIRVTMDRLVTKNAQEVLPTYAVAMGSALITGLATALVKA
jgi:hypothetical protein